MGSTIKKEFFGIYFVIPTILFLLNNKFVTLLSFYGVTLFVVYKLKYEEKFCFATLFKKVDWAYCFFFFIIFLISGYLYTYALDESLLLNFPRESFFVWLIVMFIYPFLSVIPQEIIFRVFFFSRYKTYFLNKNTFLVVINSIVFSFCHIVFNNLHALVITGIVSPIFAHAYINKSFLTCVVIHTLGGQIIFTLGLGKYFF